MKFLDRIIAFIWGLGIMVGWGGLLCGLAFLIRWIYPEILEHRRLGFVLLLVFGLALLPGIWLGGAIMSFAFDSNKRPSIKINSNGSPDGEENI
ncbi:MAG: hypothetical protein ACYTEM_02310 [Planctomycetota bacterium]|jgi:hypothetical protein